MHRCREIFVTPGPFGWLPLYDDSYITLISAQALWSGGIPSYPDTPPLHGVTSPVHVAIVAALLVALSPMGALWASQVIGAAVYVSGLWGLGRNFGLSAPVSLTFVAVGVTAGVVPYHLFSGLETGLALGSVTWTLTLTRRASGWSPFLYGTLPFVRPELGILAIACAAWMVWHQPAHTRLRVFGLMALSAAPWLAFTWWGAGSVVPASAAAKAAFVADRCWSTGLKTLVLVWSAKTWAIGLGLASIGIVGLFLRGLSRVYGIVFCAVLVLYTTGLPSHLLKYQHQRYLYAWAPIILFGLLALIKHRLHESGIVLAVLLGVNAVIVIPTWKEVQRWHDAFVAEQQALRSWLAENVPPDSRILVTDAGYLAYATEFQLVDAVGLKSPSSADVHLAVTLPSCGRNRGAAMTTIARLTNATHLVTWGEWEASSQTAPAMRSAGWRVQEIRGKPGFVQDDWWYRVFALSDKAAFE